MKTKKTKIRLAVVIPAYNEEKTLPALLESLNKQKTRHSFEVIVSNNNSTDKTATIIEEYQKKMGNLKTVFEKEQGIGITRKTGFEFADAEIMAGTDSDITMPEDWVERVVNYFDNEDIVALVGCYKFRDKGAFVNFLFYYSEIFFDFIHRLITGSYGFRGTNFATRSTTYKESGGMNASISALEDIELSMRIAKLGKIKYAPSLVVYSTYRRFEGRFIKQLIQRLKAYYYRVILRRNDKASEWDIVRK